jgi:hypothetical protein
VPGASPLEGSSTDLARDGSASAAGELFGCSSAAPLSATALGSGDFLAVLCFSGAGTLGSSEFTGVAETGGAVAPVPSSAARDTRLRTAARFRPVALRAASCRAAAFFAAERRAVADALRVG